MEARALETATKNICLLRFTEGASFSILFWKKGEFWPEARIFFLKTQSNKRFMPHICSQFHLCKEAYAEAAKCDEF